MGNTYKFLSRINTPADLKHYSRAQLLQIAQELRQCLLEHVSQTGGHLASNLGTVELTIALHKVLDLPNDKLVWDVGHQAYPHKILSGRREQFNTLRQYGGISGFPRIQESPYDSWGAGHAGTAISGALGLALAHKHNNTTQRVVAVAGDGALTAGMSFEALNHAGSMELPLLVILNDNEMSIAENVGALSRYFNRLITTPVYNRLKTDLRELVEGFPRLGRSTCETIRRIEEGIKNLIVPDMLFEELGFRYFGPVDGHDLNRLIDTLQAVLSVIDGPALLHVITEKGRGYAPATQAPDQFHGVAPFDVETGKLSKPATLLPTYTRVFSDTLIEIAEQDLRVVGITAAMPQGTGLDRFQDQFPDRYYDVGIAEQHAVTLAAGMALGGLRPVVAIYSTFLQRSFDQVLHDVCLQNLPVIFAIDRAGLVGEDGETHQGVFDISYLRCIPNLVLAAPKDENELRHLFYTALHADCPMAIRYPRSQVTGVALDQVLRTIEIGCWEVVRAGNDLTLLATGVMVNTALGVADQLAEEAGVSCRVVNARFIAPLDERLLLRCAAETGHLVTMEEHLLAGGFGSAVSETLVRAEYQVPQLAIGLPREFIPHGTIPELRQRYGLDETQCGKRVLEWYRTHQQPQQYPNIEVLPG